MGEEDATQKLDTELDRLKPGDKLWVEVEDNGLAKNPFERDHEYIQVRDAKPGEKVFVEITSKPGGIRARVIHREENEEDKDPDVLSDPSREKKVVWRGTEQDPSREEAKNRSAIQKEGDVRGSKNDLLGGHL